MRATLLLSVVASALVSATVTALLILVALPVAVDAQVAKLSGPALEVVGEPDGRPGVTAEVGHAGGGILRVFGSDGTTVRLSMNSSAQTSAATVTPAQAATDSGIAPNAGMNVYNVNGLEVVRVGSIGALSGYGLNLRDAQGKTRYRVVVDGDGNPSVQLFDADGNVIWSAP